MRRLFILACLLLALAMPSFATTYFVDFSGGADSNNGTTKGTPWKHVKGMTGCTGTCSSTTPVSGDTITFKGGVIWTSSFPWTFVTGSSTNIVYTTDHTWFNGGSYTQPTFDDQNVGVSSVGMANTNSGTGHITVNDMNWVNCDAAMTTNSSSCVVFNESHDVTWTNNTMATESQRCMYFPFNVTGSYSNFIITGNDFSHCASAMWWASLQANTSEHNLTYNNNTFHDFTSQIGGGVHSDGAMHYFINPFNDTTQFADGVTFCDNRFYGDWRRSYGVDGAVTAFFFIEGPMSATLCNNDFSYNTIQASNQFQAEFLIWEHGNADAITVGLYNNSFAAIGTSQMSAAFDLDALGSGSTVTFKNNIIYAPQTAMFVETTTDVAALVSDYNLLNSSSSTMDTPSGAVSYGTWQTLGSPTFDAHSLLGSNPLWVSAPGNETLQVTSPAISAGTNLTSLGITILNSDILGNARPSGATAWTMGAYNSGGDTTPPVPGNSGTITTSGVTQTSITLNWTLGTDDTSPQSTLQYKGYQSLSNNITTVANMAANGTVVFNLTTNISTATVSTGLNCGTTYFFNLYLQDQAGNTAPYTTVSQATSACSGGALPGTGRGGK